MVYLNENISFNIKTLKQSLTIEFQSLLDKYDNIINDDIIESLKGELEKKVNTLFSNDKFVYLNMNENHCTHKYRKGTKDGHFCGRKINTNLIDNKKDYLCCSHSKKHIPKKRKEKLIQSPTHQIEKRSDVKNNKRTKCVMSNKTTRNGGIDKNKKRTTICKNIRNNKYIQSVYTNYISNNIYKNNIYNKDGTYTKLIKEIPLLDFCISNRASRYF
jgi:hypothetical protein